MKRDPRDFDRDWAIEVRELVDAGAEEREILQRVASALSCDAVSTFVLDAAGRTLHASDVWDWTRGQFRVSLDLWPSVKEALDAGRSAPVTRCSARGLELEWFEAGGIGSSACAPLLGAEGPVGVLFADAGEEGFAWDLERVAGVAREVARLHEQAPGQLATRVEQLMSREPVLIDVRTSASVAERVAQTEGVHHLLAARDGRLCGVLCRCDLRAASPSATVASVMQGEVVVAAPTDEPDVAARRMFEHGVGCLPVVTESGRLVGVITRRDLRGCGSLGARHGVDACAACGSTHGLSPGDSDRAGLCAACLSAPEREATLDPYYAGPSGGSG